MFKNQSIFSKTAIMLSIVISISIFAYFVLSNAEKSKQSYSNTIKVLERNILLTNKILLHSSDIYKDEQKNKDKLSAFINVYDFTIAILKNGGIVTGFAEDIILNEPSEKLEEQISILEKQWFKYKINAKKIIQEPTYTFIRIQKDTVINETIKEITVTKNIKNINVINANKYLSDNIITLQNINNEIILYLQQEKNNIQTKQNIILITSILMYLLFSVWILLHINKNIKVPVKKLNSSLNMLIEADSEIDILQTKSNEFNPVFNNIEKLSLKLKDISAFIKKLGENNLDIRLTEYNRQSQIDTGLVSLRDILKRSAAEEAKRKETEQFRQWAVDGTTNFNEILRNSSADIKSLADAVIKNLVLFLKASQGGIFILNKDNKQDIFLELSSAFAYDRKKFFTKKIPVGEGLVGMCALEKNTIWLNNIPVDYMEIESGLGEAPPKSLLIAPLKTDTELLGIIELASFHELKRHEVDFVENIANNIASSIETAKINERTKELLKESRKKSEELANQDTEIRMKINELRDAQEIARKNETEISTLVTAVDNTLLKAEVSRRGRILSVNRFFLNKTDYHSEDLTNNPFLELMSKEGAEEFNEITKKVFEGETVKITFAIYSKHGKKIWLLSQFTPIRDESGKITGMLFLGNDITAKKETEEKNDKLLKETLEKAEILSQKDSQMMQNFEVLKKSQEEIIKKEFEERALLSAIDDNLIKAEYDTNGVTITANPKFIESLKYKEDEIININIKNVFPKEISEKINDIWKILLEGKPFQDTIKLYDKNQNELWWLISFTPVRDQKKTITKILFLANNVTDLKNAELKIEMQTKALEEQEEYLTQNMAEMMDQSEKIEEKTAQIKKIENELKQKFEKESDKKYKDWLNSLTNYL